MSATHEVTIRCDEDLPGCWNGYEAVPQGSTVAAARSMAKLLGWRRVDGRLDVCPSCWPRRVRYRAGRPVGS